MSAEEIRRNFMRFGCHHIALGRQLRSGQHTAAAPWLEDKMRGVAPRIEPVRHIIEGARAYNSLKGLADPHEGVDYGSIRQSADRIHHLSRSYAALPHFDPKAVPHFEAMRDEVKHQFDHLTNRMGVKAEFVDHDPYRNAGEMAADLRNNKRIKVLKTAATGSHPFFSDHENDMFRAVHDAFGHAGTGRDFDGHGEEAAFHSHARMFSGQARGALASETRGQNGFVIHHDEFGPQKIALMHHSLWTPEGMHHEAKVDWDEYRRVQDGQQRRYERAGVGGGQAEHDEYFGRGEYEGRGREQLITPKDWITHSNHAPRMDEIDDPAFHANWAGYQMGHAHGRAGEINHGDLDAGHSSSTHPEDFLNGYHEGLSDGFGDASRVAVLLDDDGKPTEYFTACASLVGTQKTAHVSGNQVDVLHCPFCFTGTSRYITRDGIKTFAETVGTTQWVLTADRDQRTAGRWVEAHIHEFGEQPIMRVTVQRNKRTKVIEATPEHRWLVKANLKRREGARQRIDRVGRERDWKADACARGHLYEVGSHRVKSDGSRDCLICARETLPVNGIARSTNRDVITRDLRPGHRLSLLRMAGVGELAPAEDGIRHGVVFGDGSANGKYATVTLWGEKDKQLLRYFPNRRYATDNTASRVLGTGVPGVRVSGDLWAWMKAVPDSADPAYLYGWLAGYFAADGSVSKQGQVSISSANLAHLEAFRDIAIGLGIATYDISMKMRAGFVGREPSALYTLELLGSTLNEDFFLIEDHRDRFRFRDYAYERFGWTVVSVEETDRIEPVYCAVVPETHSFALEGNIWVGNCGSGAIVARSDGSISCTFCNAAFTVTVSPMYSSFPMSVGGQPYPWPGRPDGGVDPSMMQMGDQPGGGFGGQLIPGGGDAGGDGDNPFADGGDGDDEGDDDGNPFAGDSGDSSSGDDDDEDKEAEVGGSKKPPFGKKKSSRLYKTAHGGVVPEADYLKHLALATAKDPNALAARIRAERGA